MRKSLLYFISAVLLLVWSCKKEMNFDKFSKPKLNLEIGLPVAILDIKMSDLLKKNDTTILYDPDGFIRFAFRQDSIGSFTADSVFKASTIAPVTNSAKLGEISIADFEASSSSDLDTLVQGFSPATQAGYNLVKGNTAIFPAFDDANNVIRPFSSPANFNSVTFSNGWLIMEFSNYLPVTITTVSMNLYNRLPIATLIGNLNYSNIPPNGSKKDSINLTGITLTNNLGYNIPTFKSLASSSSVLIDPNDSIVITSTSRDLKAVSGTAVFPSQSIDAQALAVDLASPDGERIRNLEFKTANINYSVTSSVDELISISLEFPGATKNGNPFPPQIIQVNNNTTAGTIDLADVKVDMSLDGAQPYNRFKVNIKPSIVSSNMPKAFDSSNSIVANFTFDDVKPKAVEGYLGSRTINISQGNLDAEFFASMQSGLTLDDPKLKVNSSNSLGLPISLNLNLVGTRDNNSQPLNATPFVLSYPTLAQKGQQIVGQHVINKSNSQLVNVIAIAPTKMNYSGNATVNSAGFTGYNDFVDENSKLFIGFEMDLPFSLSTNNFVVNDTTNNFVPTDNVDEIQYIDIITKIENGFPFDGGFKFYFTDSAYRIIDSLDAPIMFASAVPDANGRTAQTTIVVKTITFEKAFIEKLKQFNAKFVLYSTKLNTYANGTVPVKIYSDYTTKIGLSIKAKYVSK